MDELRGLEGPTVRIPKSKRARWTGYAARMRQMNSYKILRGNPLREYKWMELAQDPVQCSILAQVVLNIRLMLQHG
jgi:hypothetical protein